MTAKHRMSLKLTRDQRRLLKRVAKHCKLSMTEVLTRGLEMFSEQVKAEQVANDTEGGKYEQ
jgi:uncharacterized protein (DUF1778 family)